MASSGNRRFSSIVALSSTVSAKRESEVGFTAKADVLRPVGRALNSVSECFCSQIYLLPCRLLHWGRLVKGLNSVFQAFENEDGPTRTKLSDYDCKSP